jgi:uncharacterized membrane protein YozB (DUF420 family)
MQQSDLMLTSAQIGMALAGFAGLVTLLARPNPRADARLNETAELHFSDAESWRLASAVYSVTALAFLWHSLQRNQRIMGRVLIAGGVTAALFVLCGGEFLALALDALGFFPGIESGVYFAALFFHFLAAAFFFIRLLYGAFPDAEA